MGGEQRYRHLFENMPIGIFVVDLTVSPAVILEANQRAGLVYGYKTREFIGLRWIQLAPKDARSAFLSVVQRVQQGEAVTSETISQHRDGTRFPVRVIAAPDPTDGSHMIVAIEEISRRETASERSGSH